MIDEARARAIATDWHGGQFTAHYSFSSSGHISTRLLIDVGRDRATLDVTPEQMAELDLLYGYVVEALNLKCAAGDHEFYPTDTEMICAHCGHEPGAP